MEHILQVIDQFQAKVYGVTVVRDGVSRTVYPRDHELNDETATVRNIYSVAKTFTMAAVGFCSDAGLLRPEEKLSDVFPSFPADGDEQWKDVTVHQLLRHESGCRCGNDLDCENLRDYTDGDWVDYIFRKPIEDAPGTVSHYSDIHFYLLSCAVTLRTGKPLTDWMREKLFNPAGFREAAWSTDPQGRALGGTGLYLSTGDVAKLGQLWVDRGVWNGKRLLSEEWIDRALEQEYALTCRDKEKQTYYKNGMFGQTLLFSMADRTVLAMESYTGTLNRILDELYPKNV